METACEWPDPRDSHTLKEQRRTGASYLSGSIAAQNDITVTGNLMMFLFQSFEREGEGAGDNKRVRREFERGTHIQDRQVLTCIQSLLHLFGGDSGDG